MKKPTEQEVMSRALGETFFYRSPALERAVSTGEDRTVNAAITSDAPIRHSFGELILNHAPEAIRLDRFKSGAPVLLEHQRGKKIGGWKNPTTDGHTLRADAQFSTTKKAEREWKDQQAGIGRGVSGGFLLHHLVLVEEREDDYDLYRSDDWEPFEGSFVSVPADFTVGVGRTLDLAQPASDVPPVVTQAEPHTEQPATVPAVVTERALPATAEPPTLTRSLMEEQDQLEEQLLAIGRRFAEEELATSFALARKTPQELRDAIFAKRTTTQAPTPVPPVTLTAKELRQYSVARAVQLQLAQREGRDDDAQGFERDVSNEISKKLPMGVAARGGIFVPTLHKREELVRAGLEAKTANLGGNSIFTEYGGFLDLLRNSTKVLAMGATMLPGLTGPVSFVKQASDSVAYWVGENPGTDVTASDLTLGLVTLNPKTMMARSAFSRQLMAQSQLTIDSLVQTSLVNAHAIKLDNSALHADGTSNSITGIYSQSGVNVVAMGGNPTYAKAVDMETSVRVANANIGPMGYLTTEQVRGKAKQTLEFAVNGSGRLWDGDTMNGLRAEATTNAATNLGAGTNEHAMVCAVWSALLFGEWGAMELLVDPYTLAGQAMLRVVSYMMCDLQMKYGPCFTKGTGLILS